MAYYNSRPGEFSAWMESKSNDDIVNDPKGSEADEEASSSSFPSVSKAFEMVPLGGSAATADENRRGKERMYGDEEDEEAIPRVTHHIHGEDGDGNDDGRSRVTNVTQSMNAATLMWRSAVHGRWRKMNDDESAGRSKVDDEDEDPSESDEPLDDEEEENEDDVSFIVPVLPGTSEWLVEWERPCSVPQLFSWLAVLLHVLVLMVMCAEAGAHLIDDVRVVAGCAGVLVAASALALVAHFTGICREWRRKRISLRPRCKVFPLKKDGTMRRSPASGLARDDVTRPIMQAPIVLSALVFFLAILGWYLDNDDSFGVHPYAALRDAYYNQSAAAADGARLFEDAVVPYSVYMTIVTIYIATGVSVVLFVISVGVSGSFFRRSREMVRTTIGKDLEQAFDDTQREAHEAAAKVRKLRRSFKNASNYLRDQHRHRSNGGDSTVPPRP